MAIRAKYENGKLLLLEKAKLQNNKIYEIDVHEPQKKKVKTIKPHELKSLCGIMSAGGDAIKDTEECFE